VFCGSLFKRHRHVDMQAQAEKYSSIDDVLINIVYIRSVVCAHLLLLSLILFYLYKRRRR